MLTLPNIETFLNFSNQIKNKHYHLLNACSVLGIVQSTAVTNK